MRVLVTGGLGYIGSNVAAELLLQSHDVTILDNQYNASDDVIIDIAAVAGKQPVYVDGDVRSAIDVGLALNANKIDAVIHCAGLKAVGESVVDPLTYYDNNVGGLIATLLACKTSGVKSFIFSSSACVYGGSDLPYHENLPLHPYGNPYGQTKVACEQILESWAKSDREVRVTALRYFNPIGAVGPLADRPKNKANNLMPAIKEATRTGKPVKVFGTDYSTPDGSALRDYIDIADLARGHVAALDHLKPGFDVYNLGTGKPTSVLDMIVYFEEASKVQLTVEDAGRRAGDLPAFWADCSKAELELGWKATNTVQASCWSEWIARDGLSSLQQ